VEPGPGILRSGDRSSVVRGGGTGGTANGLFPTYDLPNEQQAMATVAASTTVPVPATFGVEEDTSVLGGPFLPGVLAGARQ
jgi:aminoglycoside phosphotransferase (APT) family kinase protein